MEQKRKAGDIGDSCSKKTKSGNEEIWQSFYYKSYPPERNNFNNTVVYTHWLPDDYSTLGSDGQYEEFDTLIHATSFSVAFEIFKTDKLKQQLVKDSSIVNPHTMHTMFDQHDTSVQFNNIHPLSRSELVWYGPYQVDKLRKADVSIERYGNVIFLMKTLNGSGGIVSDTNEFKYYFVEIIDYVTQSACRILVTKKEYPDLLPYDPKQKGGPWYIDANTGKHQHVITIKNLRGKIVKNTVEFMREEESYEPLKTLWLANHHITCKQCDNPRQGVFIARDGHNSLRLALGLLGCKTKYKENKILQDWAVISEDGRDVLHVIEKFHLEYENSHTFNENTTMGLDMPTFTMEDILSKNTSEIFKAKDMKGVYFDMLSSVNTTRRLHFLQTLQDALKSIFFNGKSQTCQKESFLKEKLLKHKVIKLRRHWQYFNFKIMHGKMNDQSGDTTALIHWLPEDYRSVGKAEDYEECILVKSPTETNFTIDKTYDYYPFRPNVHLIDDYSVVNPLCTVYEIGEEKGTNYYLHPLARSEVFSYYAETKKNMKDETYKEKNYTNETYAMYDLWGWKGIIKEGFLNYYLVEIIDYPMDSVCRILVTGNIYPSLHRYDITQLGGPCMWDGDLKQLKRIHNSKGELVNNKVEFLREGNKSYFTVEERYRNGQYNSWQNNHYKVG